MHPIKLPLSKHPELTRDILIREYASLSITAIARKYHVSAPSLIKLFNYYSIPKKSTGFWSHTTPQQKVDAILKQFPDLILTDIQRDYVNGASLPDLLRKHGLDFSQSQKILRFLGVKLRNASAAGVRAYPKKQKTYIQKYGVDNPSKSELIKQKKRETFIKHYGVDNIWKTEQFRKNLDIFFTQKYGISVSERRSIKSRQIWANKTKKEREEWLDKSIRSEKAIANLRNPKKGYNSSKLEVRFSEALDALQFTYIRQFKIQQGKKRRFYDFYLPDLQLIIEIYGEYWHADPYMYDKDDLIHYTFANIKASDIWEKDRQRIEFAKKNKYRHIIIVWEREIKNKTLAEIIETTKQKILEYEPDQNKKCAKNQESI